MCSEIMDPFTVIGNKDVQNIRPSDKPGYFEESIKINQYLRSLIW